MIQIHSGETSRPREFVARLVTTRPHALKLTSLTFNPLSPNSDQHQFSPNDIHTLSRDYVMRINKKIAKEKMPSSFINFSQLICKKMYGDQFGKFVCGCWGLKG